MRHLSTFSTASTTGTFEAEGERVVVSPDTASIGSNRCTCCTGAWCAFGRTSPTSGPGSNDGPAPQWEPNNRHARRARAAIDRKGTGKWKILKR